MPDPQTFLPTAPFLTESTRPLLYNNNPISRKLEPHFGGSVEKYGNKSADVENESDENVPFLTDMKARQCEEAASLARSCYARFFFFCLKRKRHTEQIMHQTL